MSTNEITTDTAQIGHVESSGDNVLATVYSFDRVTIRQFLYQEITILEVSGSYSPTLGKLLERQVAKAKNNLGLDLSGVSGLQSGILSTLQRIHKKLRARGSAFLLCNPPDRLIDLLKLNDLLDSFRIASGLDDVSATTSILDGLEGNESVDLAEEPVGADDLPVSKQIAQFNQSLKRTEKLEKGLDSASRCIRKILPSRCPQHEDYDFAFSYKPSDKVGGDFFDFIPLGKGLLGVSIGDVSGHGLDSAIIMAMTKKIIRVRARDLAHRDTRDVLCQANADLHEELGSRIFITALYARIDLARGLIHFARAGHEPPVHFFPSSKDPPTVHNSAGIAIGIDSGPRFNQIIEEKCIQLGSGEGLLFYTDGIVERWNARRDLFSRPRLLYALEQMQSTCTADLAIQHIDLAVDQFAQGTPAEDDMTAIVITRD